MTRRSAIARGLAGQVIHAAALEHLDSLELGEPKELRPARDQPWQ